MIIINRNLFEQTKHTTVLDLSTLNRDMFQSSWNAVRNLQLSSWRQGINLVQHEHVQCSGSIIKHLKPLKLKLIYSFQFITCNLQVLVVNF